jgi:catechol 2,3-dioxygenase-like lactoylglutathione lyase family enzyme
MKITYNRLHHVQLCIPTGEEQTARAFYTDILGLKEIPKPSSLIANGGIWYEIGNIELHIGTENMEAEKGKRHPAFEVNNILEVKKYLISRQISIKEETPIPSIERFSFFDPFGNRMEFMEKK